MFGDGPENGEDLLASVIPSTYSINKNVDKIKQMVLENCHLSLRTPKIGHEVSGCSARSQRAEFSANNSSEENV